MIVIRVLGPLALHAADGSEVRLSSSRQRRLLTALTLRAGVPTGSDELIELVWGERLPADPHGALQTNVARLRRLLPEAVGLSTASRAYQLVADRRAVDVTRFTDHLARAAELDDAGRRLAELEAALALWRGRPFAELDHPAVAPEVARLTGLRATAVEQQAEALILTGRPGPAAVVLDALVAAEPLREGAVGLLMRSLVAAGRPSEALRAFARLRRALAEELGLDPSAEVRRLHEQVLRQEPAAAPEATPAARAAAAGPPLPVSSFVGRDADLELVVSMLAERRIVTLCGPGGVGKSRLARHAAALVAGSYQDGALLVDLGHGGADAVDAGVAAALRLSESGSASLTERIVEVLAVRQQLLVLDNCEHVAEPVAALAERVASGAPGVDLLLTSREALWADGEQVVPVAPLSPGSAGALLADRIRAAHPAATPTPDDAELVAQVCRRLDGLPLALELAAARVPAVGLRGLLVALEAPLETLRLGRRTAAPRHRSLRDVIQWSFGLLEPEQASLFVRMAVFAGAVEPAAVAAVCGGAAALPDLVDRSLVVRHAGEPVSYGMLETLRAFGRSRLATDPQAAELHSRHAAWALELVSDLGASRSRPDEGSAVRRLDAHLADVRRAHAWLCANGPLEDALQLGLVVAEHGFLRARADLVRMAGEALIAAGYDPNGAPEATDGALHPLVPRLLGRLANAAWQRGDLAGAQRLGTRALTVAERLGDPGLGRDALDALANTAGFRGELTLARELAERGLELSVLAGDLPTQLICLVDLTTFAAYTGNHAEAADRERAADRIAAQLGSPVALGWAAYGVGERRAECGAPDATWFLQRAVQLAEQADGVFLAGVARHTLLTTAARTDDAAAPVSRFGPLIDTWHGLGAWTQLWLAVRALIEALSRRGRHRDAALLLGAMRASPRASLESGADSARAEAVERVGRDALGARYEALIAEGAALGDSGAVTLARQLTRL